MIKKRTLNGDFLKKKKIVMKARIIFIKRKKKFKEEFF